MTFQKLLTIQVFGLELCALRQDTFYPRQNVNNFFFYKKSILYFIGWFVWNWKNAADLHLAKNWNVSTKVWQSLLFLSTFSTSSRCFAEGNQKSWLCASCKLWIYWSVKNNGTKYLLIFDDSCEQVCNSKVFVDPTTGVRHRGLSTIYIKHNFFHQSKLGRDVELQNTHIVLFKPPRDVMRKTTLTHSWLLVQS